MIEEIESVKESVCKEFGITQKVFLAKKKEGSASIARYVYYYLVKKYGLITTIKEIGESIGRKETNAYYGIKNIKEYVELDYNFSRRVKRIEKQLNFEL